MKIVGRYNNLPDFREEIKKMICGRDIPPMCYIRSFGCRQNVSDGERLAGVVSSLGYALTDDIDKADLIIYNTCAVRESAQERAFGIIGQLKGRKERNPGIITAVGGCMVMQPHVVERLRKTYRYVDILFGTNAFGQLPELIYGALAGNRGADIFHASDIDCEAAPIRESAFKADVPIMYGCDNFCSYCIVPYVRGRERSRNPEAVLNEIKALASGGVKEITLLGQNVNSYGKGLTEKINFSELLRRIDIIEGDFKTGFMSSHPKDATAELIDAIFECKKTYKRLHLPLQSGSDAVLSAMNRGYTAGQYMEIIGYARKKDPEFPFSTDIIVGFPGETYEDFRQTLEIIKKVKFTNIFTFIFSKREGTKAALMEDNIPYEEKSAWFKELLALQRELGTEVNSRLVGRVIPVLFDGEGKREGFITGKSDGAIIVEAECRDKRLIGERALVKINKAKNWAVEGEIIV